MWTSTSLPKRAVAWGGLSALLACASVSGQTQYTPRVPAVWPGAVVESGGGPISSDSYIDDQPIDFVVQGPPGAARAIIEFPEAGVTIIMSAVSADIGVTEEGGVHVQVTEWSAGDGWLDVYHERAAPVALVEANGSSLNLGRGMLRVTADNRIVTPETDPGVAARIDADYREIVRASLVPELTRVAESVAEGDIEPPTQAAAIAAVSFTPSVQVREIVPRGGAVTRVGGATAGAAAAAPTQSVAEAFLTSNQAALAVVGARLQRTRVVGQGSPLSVNPNLETRFTLGRLRAGRR